MTQGKVVVKADEHGNVIGVSKNNPEYGYIKIQQSSIQINEQGWLKSVVRTALVKGKVTDLIECNFHDNQELSGKIIVKESLIPFNQENPDRDLKIAGATGIVCRVDDQPIYRQTFYTQNLNAVDELITHNNIDEIKDVQLAQKEFGNLSKLKKTITEPAIAF
jgi:hypothetical protein